MLASAKMKMIVPTGFQIRNPIRTMAAITSAIFWPPESTVWAELSGKRSRRSESAVWV